MNDTLDQRLIDGIQSLCATDDAARRLFASFAQRQRDASETSVDRAAWVAGVDYGTMLQLFRSLDALGAGRFIPGRHGHISRMAWLYSIRSLGKIAQGKGRKLESVAPDADSDEVPSGQPSVGSLNDHEFQLRSDLKIKLSLPGDLTEKEADRLGAFLKTLPL